MKHFILALAALFAISLSACSQSNKTKENNMGTKTLVAYFSATGTTAGVAKTLATEAGADLYEIQPEQPYTDADLDWTDKQSRSTVEMNDRDFRPAIKGKVEHLDSYGTVYIGFPIWWYTAPTIINTFIEQNYLKGKKIFLFATSGGSNVKKAEKDLKSAYPELDILGSKLLNHPTSEEVKKFIEEAK